MHPNIACIFNLGNKREKVEKNEQISNWASSELVERARVEPLLVLTSGVQFQSGLIAPMLVALALD
jgi:hypothetical protein